MESPGDFFYDANRKADVIMSIKSPETYGEMYWSSQVEAAAMFEEELEQGIKPFIPSIFTDPEIRASIPFDILPKLDQIFEFKSPGLSAVGGRFVSEVADQAVSMVMTPALRKTQYASNRLFQNVILTPDQATALFRRKRLTIEYFNDLFAKAGFDPLIAKQAYDSSSPFPAIPELMRWARYHGNPENVWATLYDYVEIDPIDFPKLKWLTTQQLSTDQITGLYKRDKIESPTAIEWLKRVGWEADNIGDVLDLSFVIPNAMILMQGDLFAGATKETIFTDLGKADIHADYRQKYYDAILTKPASLDLVAYHLRQENNLADLDNDLKRIGVHPEYLPIYKTLANRIPPVADIISMAVREAFSPSIAARFGQYEDFPKDFERYAKMQGLSKDWAQRYWAAHWGLPSPQQGFEMLHRGVIDKNDLQLLMKAQDIMPFWRDKMIDIAYTPLTRVDVRRMYKEGILDEKGVYKAYQNAGYDDDNAEAMTEFTIAYVLSQQSGFTSNDIVRAYSQRMIDRAEANSLLRDIGIRSGDVRIIIERADYKREWALIDAKTKAIRNLYRKGEYSENQARSELLRLNLPSVQVDTLMETWWYEKKEDGVVTFSKAETIRYIKQGLLTEKRGRTELQNMGYNQEHIDIYIKGITWKPPKQ